MVTFSTFLSQRAKYLWQRQDCGLQKAVYVPAVLLGLTKTLENIIVSSVMSKYSLMS